MEARRRHPDMGDGAGAGKPSGKRHEAERAGIAAPAYSPSRARQARSAGRSVIATSAVKAAPRMATKDAV